MKEHFSDEEIIKAILAGGKDLEKMVQHLYKRGDIRDWITQFIERRKGSKEDAEDVFQDGISHFVMNIKAGKYQTKSTLKTYLTGICKHLWFAVYKKAEKLTAFKTTYTPASKEADSPEKIIVYQEQANLLRDILDQLGGKCRQILELWSLGYSMKEIAVKVGYKNENVVSKKKHHCQKDLTAFLKNRPDLIQQLKDLDN